MLVKNQLKMFRPSENDIYLAIFNPRTCRQPLHCRATLFASSRELQKPCQGIQNSVNIPRARARASSLRHDRAIRSHLSATNFPRYCPLSSRSLTYVCVSMLDRYVEGHLTYSLSDKFKASPMDAKILFLRNHEIVQYLYFIIRILLCEIFVHPF